MALFKSLHNKKDEGLLLLRVGLGICFMIHGYPKITGGLEGWEGLGGSMQVFGITAMPVVWGFLGAASEFIGGALLVLGLFTRISTLSLIFTMVVAASVHLSKNEGFSGASHAIELGIVCLSLFIIGPGKYSIDKK